MKTFLIVTNILFFIIVLLQRMQMSRAEKLMSDSIATAQESQRIARDAQEVAKAWQKTAEDYKAIALSKRTA